MDKEKIIQITEHERRLLYSLVIEALSTEKYLKRLIVFEELKNKLSR